jgi:hypothetical protein
MSSDETRPWNEVARDADNRDDVKRDDASKVEGGAATGAIVGTAVGGPIGLAAGAAAGAVTGGAAEAGDGTESEFDRTAEPGDERSYDLRDPRMGGHVGGSDPDGA